MHARRWSGDESCGFCHQRFAYELEVFCARCDQALCPFCVVRERTVVALLCPDCAIEASAGRESTWESP